MAEQRVFLFKNEGEFNQHQVYKMGNKEAQRLVDKGVATPVQLGEYDNYRKKAQDLAKQFKKAEQKIKDSDDPRNTADVKAYELKKLAEQYKTNSQALEAEYREYRAKALDEARTKSARAKVVITDSDKATAEQLANRLALNAQIAISDADKARFADEATDTIKRLTDEQRTALQGYIGNVLDSVKDDKQRRKLVSAVRDVRNLDLLSAKVAEQLPSNCNIEYRQIKAVRRW